MTKKTSSGGSKLEKFLATLNKKEKDDLIKLLSSGNKNTDSTDIKYISTKEASQITGLPIDVLVNMRCRESTSHKSGPPFRKTNVDGNTIFEYDKAELEKWMKNKHISLTAKDAAMTLGVSRDEVLEKNQTFKMATGDLIMYPNKNLFIWVGKDKA